MTWDLPWVASGSAEIPLDVARAFTYAATDGYQGIIGPLYSDVLKITATDTPSAAVETKAGAFVAVSQFVGVSNESYVGRNDATVSTAVPATTASSRSDLVYAHITDPSQAGQPATAAPVETRVITNVASDTVSLNTVSGYENQTGLALARIDRPSGTATVQNSHIVDLRTSALSVFVGEIKAFAGNTVAIPVNWRVCDGSAISRTAFAELFATYGTSFGAGDGSTTFNLPDLRGRGLIGVGAGSGLTNRTLGASGGAETHQLTAAQSGNPLTNAVIQLNGGPNFYNTGGDADPTHRSTVTGPSNAAEAHPIMSPFVAAQYIIRVK